MSRARTPRPARKTAGVWKIAAGLCVLIAFCALSVRMYASWRSQQVKRALAAAELAIARSQIGVAGEQAARVLRLSPLEPSARVIAARCAAAEQNWDLAYQHCDRLTPTDAQRAARALLAQGKAFVEAGQARRAEEVLRLTQHLDARLIDTPLVLAFILAAEGRTWEAAPLIRQVVEQGRHQLSQLVILGSGEDFFLDQQEFLQRCRRAEPDDPLPSLARARQAVTEEQLPKAAALLQELLAHDPWLVDAQARWGQLLLKQNRVEEFLQWQQSLPAAADAHPEIWIARGLWAERTNQTQAAIRCFGEGLQRDPNLRLAHYHLGRLLEQAGLPEDSEKFRHRTELLSELNIPLGSIMQQRDAEMLQRIVSLLEQLGRMREAAAWAELSLREADVQWARETIVRIRTQYQEPPWLTDSQNLSTLIDWTAYPLPIWSVGSDLAVPQLITKSSSADYPAETTIQFLDEAALLGIRFQYYNDAQDPDNALRMFEFSGGGLAVLDYDGDGWPDLYATQGSRFPREPNPPKYVDRLFRNPGSKQNSRSADRSQPEFQDVTSSARLGDPHYSQGAAVGDLDQDGFPDIYVANIGPNRLYLNNGDGTFSDITDTANIADDDWTTSCLLADLNGDTFPDIFAVNYLTASDIYTRTCTSGGRSRQCPPAIFAPQQDRIWVNSGDGRFEELTQTLTQESIAGRGLGVLATRSESPGLLDVFVANDTDPNFWYVNQTAPGSGLLQFQELGIARGLALDGNGNPQACMGIAAGDADRNGLIDFFVTNFYRESNTLYLQSPGGLFTDETRAAGLRDPSFLMLGFGTQFLDADNDGWLDLVLTNGHVYNNTHLNEPWKMPPQFFRNLGHARFTELQPEAVGPWFKGPSLGRALVAWDWNRDRRPDFAVSHADVPLAVLTNHTNSGYHALSLSLHGVRSNRDAIGAVIRVTAGTETWTHWLNAGDGFQSSNDRRLILSLGRRELIDDLTIEWPSGETQSFKEIPANQELIVIEGRAAYARRDE